MTHYEEMLEQTACAGCLNRACGERDANVGFCSDREPRLIVRKHVSAEASAKS